ncbi:MAG: hypothetical protein H7039_09945 [Bryobacteraceae bacterium]|nr:hypothetical protein [Bryobacteraceae bacterium]
MRKNLWLLDLTLLGLIAMTGSMLRDRWAQAEVREQALMRQIIAPVPAPVLPPLTGVSPVTAAAYVEVAQQFVFSRDRNPNVILDPPPPPPPPKPMPDLPLAHGVLDVGTGPTIILSEKPGAPHHGYRPGQTIGAFKLVALTGPDVTFEWEGKQIKRKLDQITDRSSMKTTAPAPGGAAQPAASKPLTAQAPVKAGPGIELGERSRACVSGDTTPAGTVQDGFKKVVTRSPFGEVCRWEAEN